MEDSDVGQTGFMDRFVYRMSPYLYVSSLIAFFAIMFRSIHLVSKSEFRVTDIVIILLSMFLVKMSSHILRERIEISRETGHDPAIKIEGESR